MSYTYARKSRLHNYDDNILILQVFLRRQQADKEEMEGENEKRTLERQAHFCSEVKVTSQVQ